jgi:hypothetical protein
MLSRTVTLKNFLIFFLIFSFSIGCKRSKEIEKVDFSQLRNKEILEKIRVKPYEFTHLAAKAKVNALYQNKNYSFTTHIRWEFDESIWMSFTMFGIEGYRILIQPDSFKMIDKLNNQYIIEPYSYFQSLVKIDISFNDIQELLMGQALFSNAKKMDVDKGNKEISILAQDVRYINMTKLETLTGNIVSQFVQDNFNGRKMTIHQGNYYHDNLGKFPLIRDISISDKGSLINVKMDFNKIKTEEIQEYPFEIPSKYKRVD